MRTGAPAHRRTGAPWAGAYSAAAWALAGLVLAASAGNAQRLPARFGAAVASPADVPRTAPSLPTPGPVAPGPSLQRADARLTAGLFASEVVAGSVGFAAGFYGGAVAGGRSCSVIGDCTGEDPGLGRAIVGALVGSWLGTALGSHVGGGIAGGPTGSFGARLGAAAGGLLVAIGVSFFVHPDLDRPASYIALPLVAAAVTSLAVRRR